MQTDDHSLLWYSEGFLRKMKETVIHSQRTDQTIESRESNTICNVVQECFNCVGNLLSNLKIPHNRSPAVDCKVKQDEFRRIIAVQNYCTQRNVQFFGFFKCGSKVLLYNAAETNFPVFFQQCSSTDFRYTITYQFTERVCAKSEDVQLTELSCNQTLVNENRALNDQWTTSAPRQINIFDLTDSHEMFHDTVNNIMYCLDQNKCYKKVDEEHFIEVDFPVEWATFSSLNNNNIAHHFMVPGAHDHEDSMMQLDLAEDFKNETSAVTVAEKAEASTQTDITGCNLFAEITSEFVFGAQESDFE